jgi:hypothetical protein
MLNIYFGDNYILNRDYENIGLFRPLAKFLNLPYASTKYSTHNFDIQDIHLLKYNCDLFKRGILQVEKETVITDPLYYEIAEKGVWNALFLKRQNTGLDFDAGIYQYKVEDAAMDMYSDIFRYDVPTQILLADGDGIFIQDFDKIFITP